MASASSGRFASAASCGRGLATVTAVASLFGFGASARAQVLEIAPGGGVTVHDRPAVFEAGGVRPIPQVAARGTGRATSPSVALMDAARAADLGEDLIVAVAWSESRSRPGVVSKAGARGEMQLMPETARELGVDPMDSRANYRGGAAYLHRLLVRYDGDLVRTLAAYNAGPAAVDRYHGVPPYPETRAYVAAVLDRLSHAAEMTR